MLKSIILALSTSLLARTLPTTTWHVISPSDHQTIISTLTLNAEAADTKNFDLLKQVFTQDVQYSYLGTNNGSGLGNLITFSRQSVVGFTGQHILGNFLINPDSEGRSANASYYAIATLWTEPQQSVGQWVGLHGFYNVRLVKIDCDAWRVNYIQYQFLGPGKTGNVSILG